MASTTLPNVDGGSIPTSPLQFHFASIPGTLAVRLNAEWHSVLPYIPVLHVQHSFGAFFEGRIYAVALWGRPVARTLDGKGMLELRRMAIASDAPKNTASRMLAWMTRHLKKIRPDITTFISYQDTEHHKGTIYKAAGWYPVILHSHVNWGGQSQTKAPVRVRTGKVLMSPKVRWQLDVRVEKAAVTSLFD